MAFPPSVLKMWPLWPTSFPSTTCGRASRWSFRPVASRGAWASRRQRCPLRDVPSSAVERLSPVADELIITTNEADKLGFLHDMYPDLTIRLVGDAYAERGALPGLYTALAAAENPYVAVVACDMVFASARLVVAEALAMHESGADVVAPSNKHGFEPMHAMYRKEGCLGAPSAGRSACRASSTIRRLRCCPSIRIASWKLSPAAAALSMPTRPMSLLASSSPISANSRKGFAPCRT